MTRSHLIVDIEASTLDNGYPIEIAIAELENETLRAWLIKPAAAWRDREWSPASQKIHGLTRDIVEAGDEVRIVANDIDAFTDGRVLMSDNCSFDGHWLAQIFEASGVAKSCPRMRAKNLGEIAGELCARFGRSRADIEAVERMRKAAADHSAAGDAASWAATIEIVAGVEAIDPARTDDVFGKWILRATAAAPWRGER
jgi:DNA polymerase III alpha subunit (gram-positive type)